MSKESAIFVTIVFFVVSSVAKFDSVTTRYDYLIDYVLKSDQEKRILIETLGEKSDKIAYEKNFLELYYAGVEAYLSNDWLTCIENFERSNLLHGIYIEAIANCRVQCEFERNRYKTSQKYHHDSIEFYEKMIVKTLCLERCRQKNVAFLPRYFVLEQEQRDLFKMRKSYEYLQLCYFKEDEIEKAISATYTVLVANPGDAMMQKNIKYYAELKEFDLEKIRDLQDKRFSSYYEDGVDKYELKSWPEAIELIEISLDIWLQEHDKCRALCDREFDQGWLPDFTTSTSNHFVFTLRCKQNCTRELSFINGRFYEDLYPSMYNYLQLAYYQNDNLEEASRCAASYLLFYPESQEMIDNIRFYENATRRKHSKKYLQPREEANAFYQRAIDEIDLLAFVDEEFAKLVKGPFRNTTDSSRLSANEATNERNDNLIDKTVE